MRTDAPAAAAARTNGAAVAAAPASEAAAGAADAPATFAASIPACSSAPVDTSAVPAAAAAVPAAAGESLHNKPRRNSPSFPSAPASAVAGTSLHPHSAGGSAAAVIPECNASDRLLRLMEQLQQPQPSVSSSSSSSPSSLLYMGRLPSVSCFTMSGSDRRSYESNKDNRAAKLPSVPIVTRCRCSSSGSISVLPAVQFVEVPYLQWHSLSPPQAVLFPAMAVPHLRTSQQVMRGSWPLCLATATLLSSFFTSRAAAASAAVRDPPGAAAAARRRVASAGAAAASVRRKCPSSTAATAQHAARVLSAFFSPAVAATVTCPSEARRFAAATPPPVAAARASRCTAAAAAHPGGPAAAAALLRAAAAAVSPPGTAAAAAAAAGHAAAAAAAARVGVTARAVRCRMAVESAHGLADLLPAASVLPQFLCVSRSSLSCVCRPLYQLSSLLSSYRSAVLGHACSLLSSSRISSPAASVFPRMLSATSPAPAAGVYRRELATCCYGFSAGVAGVLAAPAAAAAPPLGLSAVAAASVARMTQQQRRCCYTSGVFAALVSHSRPLVTSSFIDVLQNNHVRATLCRSPALRRCCSSSRVTCRSFTVAAAAAALSLKGVRRTIAAACETQQTQHHRLQQMRISGVLTSSLLKQQRQQQTSSFVVFASSSSFSSSVSLTQRRQQQQQRQTRSCSVFASFPFSSFHSAAFSSPYSSTLFSSVWKRKCSSSKTDKSTTPQSAVLTPAAACAPSLAGPQAAWSGEILIDWPPQYSEAASSFSAATAVPGAAAATLSSHPASLSLSGAAVSASPSSGPAAIAAAFSPPAAAAGSPRHPAAAAAAARDRSAAAAAAPVLPAAPAASFPPPAASSAPPAAAAGGQSGCVGVWLNRPQQHNVLSLDMVLLLKQLLRVLDRDTRCSVLLLQGAGDRAFCAGGDVKRLHNASLHQVQQFFGNEYALDFLSSQVQKPYVAMWRGFSMGGGVGLSCFAPYRICSSNTQWAMPETAIGLFPDVGASFFLFSLLEEKYPGLPLYVGLTGVKLKAGDLCRLGVATHYVHLEQLEALRDGLKRIPGGLDAAAAHEAVQEVLSHAAAAEADRPQHLAVLSDEIIQGCREYLSLQQIPRSFKTLYAQLQQQAPTSSFCRLLLEELSGRCPLSCAVWQQALLRVSGVYGDAGKKQDREKQGEHEKAGFVEKEKQGGPVVGRGDEREGGGGEKTAGEKRRGMRLLEALEQDYRLAQALTYFHSENFKEGVRAVLISKDRSPRWNPARVEDIDDDFVESLFSCRDAEQTLQRYLSF